MEQEDIDMIMDKLIQYSICTSCNCCENCKDKKRTTWKCFNDHPGWVNIPPHSIIRVLKEFKVK